MCCWKNRLAHAQSNDADCPFYGVNASISRCYVGDIISEEKEWENETCQNAKWLKGEKFQEDAVVIWIGVMNERNRTTTDEYIKKHAKIIGQQIRVKNSVHEPVKFFAPKSRLQ
jgi:hypothetical protein